MLTSQRITEIAAAIDALEESSRAFATKLLADIQTLSHENNELRDAVIYVADLQLRRHDDVVAVRVIREAANRLAQPFVMEKLQTIIEERIIDHTMAHDEQLQMKLNDALYALDEKKDFCRYLQKELEEVKKELYKLKK